MTANWWLRSPGNNSNNASNVNNNGNVNNNNVNNTLGIRPDSPFGEIAQERFLCSVRKVKELYSRLDWQKAAAG